MIPAADLPSEATGKCDRIAYQFTAIVQPHAALLVLRPDDLVIEQASESVRDHLRREAGSLLGQPVDEAGLGVTAEEIGAAAQRALNGSPVVLASALTADARPVLLRVNKDAELITLEIEPRTHEGDVPVDRPDRWLNELAADSEGAACVDDLAAWLTDGIRGMLGYDRVMVYRFDPEWNGEIIGESKSDRAEDSFLHMRFPTRDIPKSARSMFASARVRVTVDQTSEGSPLVPRFNPRTGADVDLTYVRARAAAGSCKTYYNNMGVRATLVIPIFVENALWGLIACHHYETRRPSPVLDDTLEHLGRIASHAIERLVLRAHAASEREAAVLYERLTSVPAGDARWFDRLREQVGVLKDMVACEGFALRVGSEIQTAGETPPIDELIPLLDTLLEDEPTAPFATNAIPHEYPDHARLAARAAGALVVPLSAHPGDAAVWFRGERAQTVNWAGDPGAGLKWNEAGRPELTPRSSFELWKSTTAGTSREWTEAELLLAKSAAMRIGLLVLSWEAAQASRSKTEFLANMSHEIRTPLTAILGFADALADSGLTPEQSEHVGVLARNGHHLLKLVNEILDLSKIEAGRLSLERTATDVSELLREVGESARAQAEARGLAFEIEAPEVGHESVNLDPMRVKQILFNLIGNAVRFTKSGSVTLSCEHDAADPSALRFVVRDTGIGMSASDLARVFEPFEQADTSTTRKYGGTGLGLTISRRLAELHGGSLEAESTPREGSAFTLVVDAPAAAGPTPVHAAGRPAAREGLGGARILVAEDGADNRRLVGYFLTKAGVAVTFAENGREAVDLMDERAGDFDLILMDMQMPVMDGYEATGLIHASHPAIPIVALTAHAMQGDRERCVRAGCDEYLTKPIDRAALLETCERMIARANAARPAPAKSA